MKMSMSGYMFLIGLFCGMSGFYFALMGEPISGARMFSSGTTALFFWFVMTFIDTFNKKK